MLHTCNLSKTIPSSLHSLFTGFLRFYLNILWFQRILLKLIVHFRSIYIESLPFLNYVYKCIKIVSIVSYNPHIMTTQKKILSYTLLWVMWTLHNTFWMEFLTYRPNMKHWMPLMLPSTPLSVSLASQVVNYFNVLRGRRSHTHRSPSTLTTQTYICWFC